MAIRTVKIESGLIRGQVSGNAYVSVFKGIPYAAPPTGALRWREPQPVSPWEGIRDALSFSKIGPQPPKPEGSFYQKEYFPVHEECSEDCLYLNVWTPAVTGEERLPVFVWIHGGGFREGFSYTMGYDGDAYAASGVVVVTINYRLGIFGFLAAPEFCEESPAHSTGNFGLLDQIAALNWVRNNITAFGGDPNKVTIGGQSAGAASVQMLASSPLTKGLFSRVIMQSGAGMYALQDTSLITAKEAARTDSLPLTLNVSTPEEARALSAEEVLRRAQAGAFGKERDILPVIDGLVLTESLEDAVRHGAFREIPCLIGSTKDEGLPIFTMDRAAFRTHMEKVLGEHTPEYLKLCPMDSDEEFVPFRAQLMQERLRTATTAWCRLRDRQGEAPSYLYHFTHELPGDDHVGATHSSEHWYVFRTFLRSWRPMTEVDFRLSMTMSSFWINFIKTGDPNGAGLPEWRPYTEQRPCWMVLGDLQHCEAQTLSPREIWAAEHILDGTWRG